MSIVVNLPTEIEKTIAAEAAKAGMTLSDYVADRLRSLCGPSCRGWSSNARPACGWLRKTPSAANYGGR